MPAKRMNLRKSKPTGFILRRSIPIQKQALIGGTCGLRCSTTILDLPTELFLMIFKLLSHDDLLSNVTFVCKRWQDLTAAYWTKIKMEREMPKQMIERWISRAPLLKHLVINDRQDLNDLLGMVLQNCKELETIQLYHCSGSRRSSRVRGELMCGLLTHCRRICVIHLEDTIFNSSEFFRLLPHATETGGVSYVGRATCRELSALLESLAREGRTPTTTIAFQNISKMLNVFDERNKNQCITLVWNTARQVHLYNPNFTAQNFRFTNP